MASKHKVVFFGGGGFIGSHCADLAAREGYAVTIYDRVKSRYLNGDQIEVIADIFDESSLLAALVGATSVVFCAGMSDLRSGAREPILSIEQNIKGLCLVLDASVKAGVQHFVYASSLYAAGEYGGFYGVSKKSAESYIQQYKRLYDLDFSIIRIGSVYGPRAGDDNRINKLVLAALTDGKLSFEGMLEMSRAYIHVLDVARIFVDSLKLSSFRNSIVEIFGDRSFTMSEVLLVMSECLGVPIGSVVDTRVGENYLSTPKTEDVVLVSEIRPIKMIGFVEGIVELAQTLSYEISQRK